MFFNKKNKEDQINKKNIKVDFLDSSFNYKKNLTTPESLKKKPFFGQSFTEPKIAEKNVIAKSKINIPEEKIKLSPVNKEITQPIIKKKKTSFFNSLFSTAKKPDIAIKNNLPILKSDDKVILDKIQPENIIEHLKAKEIPTQIKKLETPKPKKSFFSQLFSEPKKIEPSVAIKPKINIPEAKIETPITNHKTDIDKSKSIENKKPFFNLLFNKSVKPSEKKLTTDITSTKKEITPDAVIANLKKDGIMIDHAKTEPNKKPSFWQSFIKKSKKSPTPAIKLPIDIPKVELKSKSNPIELPKKPIDTKESKIIKPKKSFWHFIKKDQKKIDLKQKDVVKKEKEPVVTEKIPTIKPPIKKITTGTIISRIRAESQTDKPGFFTSLFHKSAKGAEVKDKKLDIHIPEEDRREEWKKEIAENSKKPIIEATDVSITYNLGKANELHALKNANVKIYPGEYVIFFGPSGCGKSTLLFALAGLQAITKGSIFIDGLEISKTKASSMEMVNFHRTKIGIIFQAFFLIPSLNIFKNIGLPRVFLSTPTKERNEKVEALLKRFDIEAQAKKLPSQLSGGQQQRVAIARALVNDPKILFADEPVGNLDTKSSDVVLEILKQLNEEDGRTIILVTHDARHLSFANRVFHLKDGLIIKETVNNDIRPTKVKIEEEQKRPEVTGEMDLLLRTYSGLSSAQLSGMIIPYKAKQLVQDVLIGMSGDQIKNIEKTVEEYLMNIHSENYSIMEKTFDESLEKGGVGLDSRTAEALTEKIKNVLEEIKYLKNVELSEKDYKVSGSPEKIQHLRKFLLDKYDIHIKDEETIKRLDEIIQIRLENKIDSYRLRKTLDKSLKLGGVGLDSRNAKKIAKEMELIMLLKFK